MERRRVDDDVSEVEGDTGLECLLVTEVLDVVKELGGAGYTGELDDVGDDLAQRLLSEHLVYERYLIWYILVYDDAAGCGLNHQDDT